MRRKFLSLIFVMGISMAALLTGCTGSDTTGAKEAVQVEKDEEILEEEIEEETKEEEEETKNEETNEKETKEEETSDEEVDDEEADEEKDEAFVMQRGVIEDDVYTNEMMGITFSIDEDIVIMEDEQVNQAMDFGGEMVQEGLDISLEAYEKAMNGTVYDLMMILPDNTSNIIIAYENMDITANGLHLTEKQYAGLLENNFDAMSNVDYELLNKETVEIAGQEYLELDWAADYGQGALLYQTYYLRRMDNYMVFIVATSSADSPTITEDYIDAIQPIE